MEQPTASFPTHVGGGRRPGREEAGPTAGPEDAANHSAKGEVLESEISKAIGLKTHPVAVLFSDELPSAAKHFKKGKWACVMWLFANAARGRVAVLDRERFGCPGGATGIGFGNFYERWPGGVDLFCHFLSQGVKNDPDAREVADKLRPFIGERTYRELLNGEGYVQSPELVRRFVDQLPMVDIPNQYVVLKPLKDVESELPEVVVFFVHPHQLAALVALASYARESNEAVIVPWAAGCQSLGIYAYREAASIRPRAVIGQVDLSARLQTSKQLGDETMSFAIPFRMFQEMEHNVAGSFLNRPTWRRLLLALHQDE